MTRSPRFAVLSLLTVALAACTGTEEPTTPVRLVTVDGPSTLKLTRLAENTTTTIDAGGTVVGLQTVASGTRVAVAFADRVELRDANLAVQSALTTDAFNECFVKMATDENATSIALLSACPNDPLRVAVFDPAGALRWWRTLPGNTVSSLEDIADIQLALLGDVVNTVIVTRPPAPQSETASDVIRADRDLVTPERFFNRPFIRDLATFGGRVYAATSAGVAPLDPATGELGTGILNQNTSLLRAEQGFLAAFQPSLSRLAVWNRDLSASANLSVAAELRDVTVTPDSFLYALRPSGVLQFDVASLREPRPSTVNVPLTNGRFIAWIAP